MWPSRTFRLSIAFAKAAHHSPCPARSAASAAATHARFPAREGFRASTRAALAILALAALLAAALPSPAAQAQASMTVINGTPPTYAVNIPGSPPLSFYNSANAQRLVSIYNGMKQDAVFCNYSAWQAQIQQYWRLDQTLYNIMKDLHNTYTQIYNDLNNPGVLGTVGDIFVAFGSIPSFLSSGFTSTSAGQLNEAWDAYVQANRDFAAMDAAYDFLPKFPKNCNPPTTSTTPQPHRHSARRSA
jgi:hypothetical protein